MKIILVIMLFKNMSEKKKHNYFEIFGILVHYLNHYDSNSF